jgi:signal transduction histidine kinase
VPEFPPSSSPEHVIRAARLQVAFEGQLTSLALGTVLATVTLIVLWPASPAVNAVCWYTLSIAVTVVRVCLYLAHRGIGVATAPERLERFERLFVWTCWAAGISWGLASVLIFSSVPSHKMFLAFVMAGVSAAAVTALSAIRRAALGFVIAVNVPLAVRLLSEFTPVDVAMSACSLMFLITVGVNITRIDSQLLALVRSRMEADEHLRVRNAQRDELQAVNERLLLAIQAGNAGIFEWDVGSNEVKYDKQLRKLYDLTQDASTFGYEDWRQRLHPEDMARVEAALAVALDTSKTINEEFRVVLPDGTERYVKAAAIVQRDHHGKAVRVVGTNSDITELKRVDRMKSEFVSIVSHELRTPLTSIRAALGLATSAGAGAVPEKVLQLLQLANRNAERLGLLIDDILDIDRIESGKLRFELAPQPLTPILEQAMAVNGAYAANRTVTLQLNTDGKEAIVAVDANRLLQVMANLLSNAVKFSPPQGTVEINLTSSARCATIEVHDHGPGIPPEFHDRMFAKFSQGDSSDRRSAGGTGLGLAISKALVESMSGSIHFRTSSTAGTSFFVELPLRSSSEPIDEAERTTVVLPVSLA